ncbi:MAG: serine protease [Patescibacteria group bacterium]
MKKQIKYRQILIFISIILSFTVLANIGYFGYKQYKNYQIERFKKEEKTQKMLDEAKLEIESLKQKTEKQERISEVLEEKVQIQKISVAITSSELTPYLYGIVQVDCGDSFGSGTLWKIGSEYFVLTNQHVVERSTYSTGYCEIPAFNINGGPPGIYYVFPSQSKRWNNYTDIALLPLLDSNNTDKTKLNYSMSTLQKCDTSISTGSPVVIIGYPAYAQRSAITQIVTNGIISGYEGAEPSLPDSNYFISAKVDSGNSGGIALSKGENGLCVLGVPTWLTVGNYETQGLVQNIWNIMHTY